MNENERIGRYLLVKTLQEKYGSSVYLGKDVDDSEVIIKVFRFHQSGWARLNQIENEVKALQDLDHDRIPKMIDYLEDEDYIAVVVQHIDAKPLVTGLVYETDKIIDITRQLQEILRYLESRNIIHHDLKPSNILMDTEGKIYLIDFGISKEMSNMTIGNTTAFGGTNGFLAPEKVLNRNVSFKSDLYSLGVTLAILATGTRESEATTLIDNNFELLPRLINDKKIDKLIRNLIRLDPRERRLAKELVADYSFVSNSDEMTQIVDSKPLSIKDKKTYSSLCVSIKNLKKQVLIDLGIILITSLSPRLFDLFSGQISSSDFAYLKMALEIGELSSYLCALFAISKLAFDIANLVLKETEKEGLMMRIDKSLPQTK